MWQDNVSEIILMIHEPGKTAFTSPPSLTSTQLRTVYNGYIVVLVAPDFATTTLPELSTESLICANVNKDTDVSIEDATAIQKYIAQIIPSFD